MGFSCSLLQAANPTHAVTASTPASPKVMILLRFMSSPIDGLIFFIIKYCRLFFNPILLFSRFVFDFLSAALLNCRLRISDKKRSGCPLRNFCNSVYSLEPVSISEPMMSFWKQPNKIMTGSTQITDAAMTGAKLFANVLCDSIVEIA